jgi:hypothetical protein
MVPRSVKAFRQARPEGGLVLGDRSPGLALALAVIVRGELLDAGAKDFSQHRHVRRQERS